MKRNIILFTIILGYLFTACNPNKDLYDAIDNAKLPYNESFDIELTNADYTSIKNLALSHWAQNEEDSTIANELDIYKSFSVYRSAADLIPLFLASEYVALDSTSSINVKYRYSTNEYDSLLVLELEDADYTAIGGVVADSLAFTYNEVPESYLPNYLATIDVTPNYIYYVTCKYWKDDITQIDTSLIYENIDGIWVNPGNTYILTSDDYNSMGSPGTYDNFSSSDPPEVYLPLFFQNKYPYAQEGEEILVFYKYYSGTTETLMDIYKFDENEWKNATDKSSPYIHNGTEWVFDPTVRYSMPLSEDYQIIVDYVTNNPDIPDGYLDSTFPESTEFYYGANSYYKNFYLKLGKRRDYDPLGLLTGLSDEEAIENMFERINEAIGIFLEAKYPDAEAVLNGVQVYYAITYETYEENSVRNFYTVTYKCTGIGEFEYASGPDLIE